eukprot:7314152-Alexandrium_andersonii.AAC.1
MPHSSPYNGQPSSPYNAPLPLHTMVATPPCAVPACTILAPRPLPSPQGGWAETCGEHRTSGHR